MGYDTLAARSSRNITLDSLLAGGTMNCDIADKYCFVWTYDGRGNVLSEHTPGGGTTQYVYDARNRMILRTDGRMDDGSGDPERRRMILTRHDMNDRIEEECYVSSPDSTVDGLRKLFRDTVLHTMSQQSIAQTLTPVRTLRTAAYFPFGTISYASSGDGAFVPETGIVSSSDLETTRIKGMLRQETVYPAPDVDGSVRSDAPSVTRYYHYDSKGRVIQLNEVWSDGRRHRVSTKYSFTGDVLATKETVVTPAASGSGPDQENSLATFYTRDQRGRILSSSRALDGTDELETVNYCYDDLGRLVSKSAGIPLSPAVETTLSYDLHGWTTGIGVTMDDGEGSQQTVFSEAIRYATPVKDLSAGRYDGNIAETAFSHRVGSSTLQTNTWSYAYDGLKRLTGANHYIGGQSVASLTDTEKSLGYDLNGNITALKRYGVSGLANDLSFTHTGNRMTALVDANATGNDAGTKVFAYDANGNLTADGRKGLEMRWNLLNLADSAAMHGSSLTYAWLSDGTKVSAKADDGSGNGLQKRYVGSFVFTSDSGSSADPATEVESIAWDEGRITYDGSSLRDCWFAGDHLGNIRTVIDITCDLDAPEILEQSDYLPFGTKIQNAAHASWTSNRWRYAGKEEQRFGLAGAFSPIENAPFSGTGFLDLSLLDFGARMYDPFTARWTAADPLAFKHNHLTTFNYCFNCPIKYYDPKGLDGYEGSNGEYRWFDNMQVASFSDDSQVEWTRVSSDKQKWDEAIKIREANIEALVSLSFDKDQASQDVRLYSEESPLFTKESLLLNPEKYTKKWNNEFNSDTMSTDALTSGELGNTGFQLKFYPSKGGDPNANSLGIVKTNRLSHIIEAGLEKIERLIYKEKADNDPLYDMHVNNAQQYLKKSK